MNERLLKILAFLKETEKLKLIERIPYLSDKKRQENDAEHSWHLAIMLMTLEKDFKAKFDILQAIKLIMVHDLVEIHTGDDFVTTEEAKAKKHAAEDKSAKKIFGLLPPDLEQEFYDLWQEYDKGKTEESKIAKGLDKLSYALQHSISKKINWHEDADSAESTRAYAAKYIDPEPALREIFDHLLAERVAKHDEFEWVKRNK